MELGKQWIKPLLEFNQFHKFTAKYKNGKFTKNDAVTIVVDGTVRNFKLDSMEREVICGRWSAFFN